MKSHPSAVEVIDDLGSKVTEGFARAVANTRKDLATYRQELPGFAGTHSERGLANWIHDRLWYHLGVHLDGLDEVHFHDQEPHREMRIGIRYRFRVKRHTETGGVSTYQTQTALDFLQQVPIQEPLEGFEEIRLIMGYVWDPEARSIGPAVISLREDRDKVVWLEELPEPGAAGATPVSPLPPKIDPAPPVVDVEGDDVEETGNDKK
ncbi:hypothetical protein ACFV4N_36965 [Actinosynnema sp. NPDC059797]